VEVTHEARELVENTRCKLVQNRDGVCIEALVWVHLLEYNVQIRIEMKPVDELGSLHP
jgi:hypothetical protein